MARRTTTREPRAAQLSTEQIRAAVPLIERRIGELKAINVDTLSEEDGPNVVNSAAQKVDATLLEVFGPDTIEYNNYRVETFRTRHMIFVSGMDLSFRADKPNVKKSIASTIASLETLRDILNERLGPDDVAGPNRILRAYGGLDLQSEIARAASKRYQDGHYADAVEAAVKALNGLVRLRSGSDLDGSKLMESVFSPNNPVLKFNSMADQSDRDEQKGFMMMFSGAVAGLRNPRAHKFIQDDPERALEFIAFVSLLAKLLDGATN